MRAATRLISVATAALLALVGCDDKPAPGAASSTVPASAAPTATTAPSASATTPPVIPAPPMPPRPVPLGSSGPIQPSAPADQQMMAIAYTLAMVTPRGNDPLTADKAYTGDLVPKLAVAVRGADKGKTPPDPVKLQKGDRKIEVQMGKGCTDRVPSMLAQRAGTTLKAAYEAGVLVISCHDDKWECHQSTRDVADVLCHAAPRH
ncbi:MAG: hypothetical protein ABJE95_11520 [Byssovorax sp.]